MYFKANKYNHLLNFTCLKMKRRWLPTQMLTKDITESKRHHMHLQMRPTHLSGWGMSYLQLPRSQNPSLHSRAPQLWQTSHWRARSSAGAETPCCGACQTAWGRAMESCPRSGCRWCRSWGNRCAARGPGWGWGGWMCGNRPGLAAWRMGGLWAEGPGWSRRSQDCWSWLCPGGPG